KEYTGLRTGRSTPTILDVVTVDVYGSKMAINQVANVTVEDAKTLRITPWDKTVTPSIDSAIRESNLGLSVSVDDKGLRIAFPELTADRRTDLIKISKQKLEEARIRIRGERQKVLSDLDKGEMPEDEQTRTKNELQKHVDETNRKLDELAAKKEKEISE
ncbi:MAG: ribosome-recycling factor, partial [Minisyncoccia bacterium]